MPIKAVARCDFTPEGQNQFHFVKDQVLWVPRHHYYWERRGRLATLEPKTGKVVWVRADNVTRVADDWDTLSAAYEPKELFF